MSYKYYNLHVFFIRYLYDLFIYAFLYFYLFIYFTILVIHETKRANVNL